MTDRYREFYEKKALSYPEHDPTSLVRYQKAVALAQLEDGMSILDIACKEAVLLDLLEQGPANSRYVGLDISSVAIAKNRARRPDAQFVIEDVVAGTSLASGSFDRIFALEILEHVPNPAALLSEARRLLKDSGRLLLSVPNPYYYMEFINELRSFPEDDGHLFAFREANIRGLFQHCGFEVEDSVGTYFQIPRQLRGAFREQNFWLLRHVPRLLACSRIYRAKKSAPA